jgi:hypothetical protein
MFSNLLKYSRLTGSKLRINRALRSRHAFGGNPCIEERRDVVLQPFLQCSLRISDFIRLLFIKIMLKTAAGFLAFNI